ncbi:MAG: hypothetical protein GX383_08935 [Clostridium sp.]|jgi:hypothetical protein|nr:hypothetical protein [Clostridium sp.]
MKKKIILASATVLFAVATMFNMNLLQGNRLGEVSLDAISVMAHAQGEIGPWGTNWKSQTFECSRTVVIGFDFILKVEKTTTTYYTAQGCGYGRGFCLATAGC